MASARGLLFALPRGGIFFFSLNSARVPVCCVLFPPFILSYGVPLGPCDQGCGTVSPPVALACVEPHPVSQVSTSFRLGLCVNLARACCLRSRPLTSSVTRCDAPTTVTPSFVFLKDFLEGGCPRVFLPVSVVPGGTDKQSRPPSPIVVSPGESWGHSLVAS